MRALPAALATSVVLLSNACSDARTPTESATGPQLGVSVNAATVTVYPSQSIQTAVNANGPSTTFLIKAGVHRRQSVIPKNNDSFIGEPGAVLDGENVVQYAFQTGDKLPHNVRIQGLVIQHYVPPVQYGVVRAGGLVASKGSVGWVVDNCEIRYNSAAGIRLGHRMQILRSYIHDNGQIGIKGLGDNIVVDGNTIAYNNSQDLYDPGWEAGGAKFTYAHGLTVRNNYVHHNHGNGIWTDINTIYAVIENNRVEDNTYQGIFHEISYDAVIRYNTVRRNGAAKVGQGLRGAGILVANSPNVEVYGNTVQGNVNGITGIQQNRGSGDYGPHDLTNLYVHNNTVTMLSGRTGVSQSIGNNAVYTSWNNRFATNTYHLGSNTTPFFWMNAARTEAQWRAYGEDVDGTFYH